MTDIFKVDSKKKCYIMHDNILVVGVPFYKLTECVTALKNGKTDSKSLWAKYVFNLDSSFRMENDRANGVLALLDDRREFIEDSEELEDIAFWLSRNLKKRHFFPSNVPVSNPQKLMRGLVAAIGVIILALILFFAKTFGFLEAVGASNTFAKMVLHFLTPQNIILAAIAIIALIGIWSAVAFFKSKDFMEVYEFGYKPAHNRR